MHERPSTPHSRAGIGDYIYIKCEQSQEYNREKQWQREGSEVEDKTEMREGRPAYKGDLHC